MCRSFIVILFCLFGTASLAAEPAKRLNLLLITVDDMNADSAGWLGNKLGATPNLDEFASSAHRFVNSHVTVPICQPCRSASERKNLSKDPNYAKDMAELSKKLLAHMKQTDDPLTSSFEKLIE